MLQGYKLFSVSHKTTHLNKIEDFVIDATNDEVLEQKLKKLKLDFEIDEMMYLSTCNRVFFFIYKQESIDINEFFYAINDKLKQLNGSLQESIEYYEDELAINHLYEVASSIDSMVVGEREILRQIRAAYQKSKTVFGLTGDKLRIAMQMAVRTAKLVYETTRIGEKPVSIVSLAVKTLMHREPARDARILMIGAGQTNVLMSKFLRKYQFTNVTIFNRSIERAESLAKSFKGKAFSLEELPNYKGGFDILLVCTGSTSKLIDQDLYSSMLNSETDKKIVVDLSIPSNIEKDVIGNNAIDFIEVDSLKKLAEENMAFRKNEITKVKELIAEKLIEFKLIYKQREIEHDFSYIPQEIKAVKEKAINVVFKKELAQVDPNTRKLIEEMMTYMEKKCIAVPIKKAKSTI